MLTMNRNRFYVAALLTLFAFTAAGQGFAPVKNKLTAKTGEKVRFDLKGSAEVIGVFTGEQGHDYAYAEKARMVEPRMILTFASYYTSGKQRKPLSVKCSSDFNGQADEASIRKARWTDLTPWCTLPSRIEGTDGKGIAPTESGPVDLTQYFDGDKPLYVGFFYRVEPFSRSEWNNRTMAVVEKIRIDADAGGVVKNAYMADRENIRIVRGDSYDNDKIVPALGGKGSAVTVRFSSDFRPSSERLAYAVTTPIRMGQAVSFGTDEPLSVKVKSDPMPGYFEHTFTSPGHYEVVFVSYDATGRKSEHKVMVKVK